MFSPLSIPCLDALLSDSRFSILMLSDRKLNPEKLSRLRNQGREMYHRILSPVNNSLIAYPMKQYDKTLSVALSIALDIINETFTVR